INCFLFMVYIHKAEIQRAPLCGFFPWQPTAGATKMTAELHQMALCKKWQDDRAVTHQNLRSVTRTTGTP
ncbi:hypothetical protein QUG40_23060, partial [Enterobacter cloacae]|uniref:hypothetical protein n=1 Tax=Enterobacter cloacae TaxID=550 RepID=UPI0025A1F50B